MSPKHKMITTIWCSITMIVTMIASHGHLIMREIMAHWPTEDTWEGRLETALYTQGGLVFVASFVIGAVILVRGYFSRANDEQIARRNMRQREQHERAAERRHEAMMDSLTNLARRSLMQDQNGSGDSENEAGGPSPKKSQSSGARPR